jgi:hypothetical protein
MKPRGGKIPGGGGNKRNDIINNHFLISPLIIVINALIIPYRILTKSKRKRKRAAAMQAQNKKATSVNIDVTIYIALSTRFKAWNKSTVIVLHWQRSILPRKSSPQAGHVRIRFNFS